jgi:hypothetical protein
VAKADKCSILQKNYIEMAQKKSPPKHLGLGSMLGEVDPFAAMMFSDPRANMSHANRYDK